MINMESKFKFKLKNGLHGEAISKGNVYRVTYSNGVAVDILNDIVKKNIGKNIWVVSK